MRPLNNVHLILVYFLFLPHPCVIPFSPFSLTFSWFVHLIVIVWHRAIYVYKHTDLFSKWIYYICLIEGCVAAKTENAWPKTCHDKFIVVFRVVLKPTQLHQYRFFNLLVWALYNQTESKTQSPTNLTDVTSLPGRLSPHYPVVLISTEASGCTGMCCTRQVAPRCQFISL